jgi:threonine dehydratase
MSVSLEDVRAAAAVLRGQIADTPCTRSRTLSQITGADVVLKLENLQFTGSFKDRGALFKLSGLTPEQRARGVIAMSAGNHAQGVAYHAQRLGIPATIVMPRFTPSVKVEHTRAFGAQVVLHGDSFDEASEHALRSAAERGLLLIHPYDDEKIISGQGTVALEMLAQAPDLEVLVVPIGGGGLISGCAVAVWQSLRGLPVECGASTIAEGIAVKRPGELTLPIIRALVDDVLLVGEARIEECVLLLLEVEKTLAEGAGAAGLAALRQYPEHFAGRRVGLIVSGGNIDLTILSSIIERGLARTGRLVRLRVQIVDRPGVLAELTRRIGDADANIVEVHHQRAFTNLPLESAEVELVLQTRGTDHVAEIIESLSAGGYHARLVALDGA